MKAVITFIALLFIPGIDLMAKNRYEKPYYGIQLNASQIAVDLRLNDIPVYYDDQKEQLAVDIPVPQTIIDGENELKIIAFTPFLDQSNSERMTEFSPGSVVTARLFVQEMDDPDNKKEILTSISIKINDNHKIEVQKSDGTYRAKDPAILKTQHDNAIVAQSVNIKSPFPRWEWQDGQTIEDTSENYKSLLLAYKDIYDALANKDIKRIMSLYNERAKEIAIAYHLADISEGHKKLSTGEDANNPDLELYTFWEKNMVLDIYGNGKLARIIGNTAPTIQPVIYLDREAGILHKHSFGFYKNSENQWIMIR